MRGDHDTNGSAHPIRRSPDVQKTGKNRRIDAFHPHNENHMSPVACPRHSVFTIGDAFRQKRESETRNKSYGDKRGSSGLMALAEIRSTNTKVIDSREQFCVHQLDTLSQGNKPMCKCTMNVKQLVVHNSKMSHRSLRIMKYNAQLFK